MANETFPVLTKGMTDEELDIILEGPDSVTGQERRRVLAEFSLRSVVYGDALRKIAEMAADALRRDDSSILFQIEADARAALGLPPEG